MIKYYAKQCDPEFTEDDLFWCGKNGIEIMDEVYAENVIIKGNKDFCKYEPKELEDLQKNIEYMNSDYRGYCGEHATITEVAKWYFKKHNNKNWSKRELSMWRKVADLNENYSRENEEEAFKLALKLITGKEWDKVCIRGYSQGDWQYMYVSSELNEKDVRYIEMCYFNTGVRYDIFDSKEDMDNNDNYLNSYYIDNWKEKETLCELLSCEEDEIEVYEICGSHTYTQHEYKLV